MKSYGYTLKRICQRAEMFESLATPVAPFNFNTSKDK